MLRSLQLFLIVALPALVLVRTRGDDREPLFSDPINLKVPPIASDKTVKYDYDIVYVRSPRKGDEQRTRWAEIAHPALMEPNADLMLLHPDGSEELLVKGGADGAITDPVVSLDGKSVYFVHVQGLKGASQHGNPPSGGADIFKMNLQSREVARITYQEFEPNRGAAVWSSDHRKPEPNRNYLPYGVLHLGPCPLPGGKLAFVSNRYAFKSPKHATPMLQLFVLEEATGNLDCIGHLNLGMALHPTVLMDGRIIFSSMESQGLRNGILWGLWSIHPDGTNWGPVISAFDTVDAPNAFHFQSQLTDGSIVAEEYYNQNNSGFGAYLKLPPSSDTYAPFGPAYANDPRNPPLRFGRHDNGKGKYYRIPFMPYGVASLTRFANNAEGEADRCELDKKDSPAVGKFTHPAGAPDNHLLTVYSPGPVNHQYSGVLPAVDGGIYLIKSGKPIDSPSEMLLIKNDPKFNEQWPRPVVSYKRIYGIDEPKTLSPLKNDGKLSSHLPEGTPFGLIGSSSLYKRESFPLGIVPEGKVTAEWKGGRDHTGYQGLDPFNTAENGASLNWFNQGADAGKYTNDDIHAIRILAMEPTTDRKGGPKSGRQFYSHANERLRVLGEIPVRKFVDGKQPLDPDGNPDTSFLAKIPADLGFTFQTLDKHGMVLNMSQTWHQLRPGEVRHDCGGCHAHSQKPTLFENTFAAQKDYPLFDLTKGTPLIASKSADMSKKQWDEKNETGLRFDEGIKNVEFYRDIRPILRRSCAPCHTERNDTSPAGNLVLDDDRLVEISHVGKMPISFLRLARDKEAKYGHKPLIGSWRQSNASRYIREFQSRRSLLIWKLYGERLDGWNNDDHPTETVPGDAKTLELKGQRVEPTRDNLNRADLDFVGTSMPPPLAVEGKYLNAKGEKIHVPGLSDEERKTFVRWIDLGCPIDFDFDPLNREGRGVGWMCDDSRPTLAVTYPQPGANAELTKIIVGAWDAYTGLNEDTLKILVNHPIDGHPKGQNIASLFTKRDGVWVYELKTPLKQLSDGAIRVLVADRQGNYTKIDRVFWVGERK